MKKSLPISVILAVKNGERFIAQYLESVFAQEFSPREILIVDGRSSDRTLEIAQSFPLVRVVTQSGNTSADAYNCGIANAQSENVALLSHDDLWTPDRFSHQVLPLIEQAHIEYSYARATFFLEENHAIPKGFRPELLQGEHHRRLWKLGSRVVRRL